MRILFDTPNHINVVCLNALTHFELAVGKIADCKWTREHLIPKRETRHETVMRVMPDADWVFHAGIEYVPPPPSKRNYKIGLYTNDIHYSWSLKTPPAEIIKKLNKANYDAFFMSYTKLASRVDPVEPIDHDIYIKRLKAPIFPLTPSVSTEIFKPSDETKLYDVAFLGSHHPTFYPFRNQIWEDLPALASKNNWKTIMKGRPPGKSRRRRFDALLKAGHIVGPKYSETLARSKAFIFGLGVMKYPCLKFMEGWASSTCIFSDPPLDYKKLHFVPDENFVDINPENWKQKLTYYMNHDEEREVIARRGHETFLKHHTSEVRAKQFVGFLEKQG